MVLLVGTRTSVFFICFFDLDLRDGGKHALVEAEQQVGEIGATDRRLGESLHETKVGQVTQERAAGMGEGQAVTPEEPLKINNGHGDQGQHDEGERGLASSKTGVEETDTGNHEKHQSGAGHEPGQVAALHTMPMVSIFRKASYLMVTMIEHIK